MKNAGVTFHQVLRFFNNKDNFPKAHQNPISNLFSVYTHTYSRICPFVFISCTFTYATNLFISYSNIMASILFFLNFLMQLAKFFQNSVLTFLLYLMCAWPRCSGYITIVSFQPPIFTFILTVFKLTTLYSITKLWNLDPFTHKNYNSSFTLTSSHINFYALPFFCAAF